MCPKEEGQQLSDRKVIIDPAVVKIVKLIYEPFAQEVFVLFVSVRQECCFTKRCGNIDQRQAACESH